MIRAFSISASAMTLQRLRMDVIAQNIANAGTTRTLAGGAFRRRQVVAQEIAPDSFQAQLSVSMANREAGGVRVQSIVEDPSPFRMVYDPGHPDADELGYVAMPNVDTVREMTDMMMATRSFEANVTAFNASKSMAMKALEIGR